ncbi:hypothetical protein ACH4TP_04865 [Streptomyces sp. NPDC021012]|uniref:hypothetical protein n=1 Tax=Streptomyces sp. NPDC021012 TaxID=3365107 RepID=UPI00378AFE77
MSGPDNGRSLARMLRVSMLALFLEAAFAAVLVVMSGSVLGSALDEAWRPEPGTEGLSGWSLMMLPLLPPLLLLLTAAVSASLVLPAVLLGEDLARRLGGRPLAWQLLLSAAAGALLLPLAGWPGWLAGAACLALAALLTRPARRGYFVSLLLWGTVAVLTAFLLGGAGVYTGVIGA